MFAWQTTNKHRETSRWETVGIFVFSLWKKKRWKGAIKISYIIFQYVQNKSCSVNHLNIKLFIIVQLSQYSLQNRQLGKNREGELWGFEGWNRLICKSCGFFQLAWKITKNTITCSWDNTGFNIHVLIRTALILARTVDGTKQTATDSSDCVRRHKLHCLPAGLPGTAAKRPVL